MNLVEIRHNLHKNPEISGEEAATASRIVKHLEALKPTKTLTNIGGHGVAAIYDSGSAGDAVLLRCELDALPIFETRLTDYRSVIDGKAHLCGHDGHMAIMLGVAERLHKNPPKHGRIILLFQPAEETGAGARAVIADPNFASIRPDYAFALHNLPGLELGQIAVKSGPLCFASEGITIELEGRTSHASHPEDAVNPANAMGELIAQLNALPAALGHDDQSALITVCHAQLGDAAFGITPGKAKIMATIRSITNELQQDLMRSAETLAIQIASNDGLKIVISHHEKFSASHNDTECVETIRTAAQALNIQTSTPQKPFRWSEDFGLFGTVSKAAMFLLGAGENSPQLHAPDYDFPDSIIVTGVDMFEHIARKHCG